MSVRTDDRPSTLLKPEKLFFAALIEFETNILLGAHVPALSPLQLWEKYFEPIEADAEIVARLRVISPNPGSSIVEVPVRGDQLTYGFSRVERIFHMFEQRITEYRAELPD
jgi:hypothetical protein